MTEKEPIELNGMPLDIFLKDLPPDLPWYLLLEAICIYFCCQDQDKIPPELENLPEHFLLELILQIQNPDLYGDKKDASSRVLPGQDEPV
jgi:hypothetical protein